MKQIKGKMAAVAFAAVLLTACQTPAGGDDERNGGSNSPSENKSEYTVTFSNNCPDTFENGNFWSCSESSPSSVKVEEGTYITLPDFTGELTKYVSSEKEGDYPFEKWNTASDGTGDSYVAGASFHVTQNITFYAIYSSEKKADSSSNEVPDGDYLDLSTTSEYSMKIWEKIQLYVENADTYSVTTGDDVVSIDSDNVMKAIGAGSATVKVTIKDSVQTYSVVVTVSADTSNNSLDSALFGKWVDDESYLQFNSDGTGYLYYKDGSYTLLNTSCNWITSTANEKKLLTISNTNTSGSDGSYEYSISGTALKITGRISLGVPDPSTWAKE